MLTPEEGKKWLKKLAVYGGIIQIFSLGVINASYNNSRWPSSRGFQLLLDFVFVSFSNPYALLTGIFVYFLFNRWADKADEMRESGNFDRKIIVLLVLLVILTIVLMQGIIVY